MHCTRNAGKRRASLGGKMPYRTMVIVSAARVIAV